MNTACMAISMCGDQFTDLREQQSILDVLVYTEYVYSRSFLSFSQTVGELWGPSRQALS